ncbi:MAG: hypothetical protein DMF95_33390 [Acidobacteria bacterium]|nr:MAG: hypothetical protein DMF95_33390 [Acidobacteriota bacterium]
MIDTFQDLRSYDTQSATPGPRGSGDRRLFQHFRWPDTFADSSTILRSLTPTDRACYRQSE